MALSTTNRAAPAAKTTGKGDAAPAKSVTEQIDTALDDTALDIVAEPGDSTAPIPDLKQADLKKRDLIDQVVARSGVKKKDAKPVVEAMLAILGETLGSGRDLNLPPMGKLRINRTHDRPGYRVIISKLRQSTGARNQPDAPLAEQPE